MELLRITQIVYWGIQKMPDNNNVQNNNTIETDARQNNNSQNFTNINFKNIKEAMKVGYSYLHPDYRRRKLFHLILVAPLTLAIYYILLYCIVVEPLEPALYAMPLLIAHIIDILLVILLIGLTVVSSYFYPFSLWWYNRSLIGRILNNMFHIGSFWVVILKIIGTLIGGIAIAGALAPITGPLTLRKCKRKNVIIGDAEDFE